MNSYYYDLPKPYSLSSVQALFDAAYMRTQGFRAGLDLDRGVKAIFLLIRFA